MVLPAAGLYPRRPRLAMQPRRRAWPPPASASSPPPCQRGRAWAGAPEMDADESSAGAEADENTDIQLFH
jgi:hypothetical protein